MQVELPVTDCYSVSCYFVLNPVVGRSLTKKPHLCGGVRQSRLSERSGASQYTLRAPSI